LSARQPDFRAESGHQVFIDCRGTVVHAAPERDLEIAVLASESVPQPASLSQADSESRSRAAGRLPGTPVPGPGPGPKPARRGGRHGAAGRGRDTEPPARRPPGPPRLSGGPGSPRLSRWPPHWRFGVRHKVNIMQQKAIQVITDRTAHATRKTPDSESLAAAPSQRPGCHRLGPGRSDGARASKAGS
jgi:hypothetical protein